VPAVLPDDMGIGESIQKSSILTSISLIVATLIQLRSAESLALSDALIVIQVGYMTYCSSLTRMQDFAKTSTSHFFTNKWILYTLFSILLFSFSVYVWARASTFGLPALPEGCINNDVIRYVSYSFHPIPPTSKKARIPALTFNSLGLIGCTQFLVALISIKLVSVWNRYVAGHYVLSKAHGDEDDESIQATPKSDYLEDSDSDTDSSAGIWDLEEVESERYRVYFMFISFPIMLLLLPLLTVCVITIELTISWNGLREETNKFTLGQIMALLMLIQPLYDVLKACRKYAERRAGRKKQRENSQSEANEEDAKPEDQIQRAGEREPALDGSGRVVRTRKTL